MRGTDRGYLETSLFISEASELSGVLSGKHDPNVLLVSVFKPVSSYYNCKMVFFSFFVALTPLLERKHGREKGYDMQQRTSVQNRTRVSCVYGMRSNHLTTCTLQECHLKVSQFGIPEVAKLLICNLNHALSSCWVWAPVTGSTNHLEWFTMKCELVRALLHSSLSHSSLSQGAQASPPVEGDGCGSSSSPTSV